MFPVNQLFYLMVDSILPIKALNNEVLEINRFREDPKSFVETFQSKIEKLKLQANKSRYTDNNLIIELSAISKSLSLLPSVAKLIQSSGLCKAADDVLEIINPQATHFYKRLNGTELSKICKKHLLKHGLLFEIVDQGGYNDEDKESFVLRCAISNLDPHRTFFKALKSSLYRFIGCSKVSSENYQVVILSSNVYEFDEDIPESDSPDKEEYITDVEMRMLQTINNFRTKPSDFQSNFKVTSKLISKNPLKKEQAMELLMISLTLGSMKSVTPFNISKGLCKAADDILKVVNLKMRHTQKEEEILHECKESIDQILEGICMKHLKSYGCLISLIDEGSHGQLLARSIVSELDKERIFYKALTSEKYSYVGFATTEVEVNGKIKERNIFILSDKVEEFEDSRRKSEVFFDQIIKDIIEMEKVSFSNKTQDSGSNITSTTRTPNNISYKVTNVGETYTKSIYMSSNSQLVEMLPTKNLEVGNSQMNQNEEIVQECEIDEVEYEIANPHAFNEHPEIAIDESDPQSFSFKQHNPAKDNTQKNRSSLCKDNDILIEMNEERSDKDLLPEAINTPQIYNNQIEEIICNEDPMILINPDTTPLLADFTEEPYSKKAKNKFSKKKQREVIVTSLVYLFYSLICTALFIDLWIISELTLNLFDCLLLITGIHGTVVSILNIRANYNKVVSLLLYIL